jgi:hypothetical protein
MSAARLEAFLAKIYVDENSRERFLADPSGEAAKAGLDEREIEALEKIDRAGLILTTRSLQKKRQRLGRSLFDHKNTKKKNTKIANILRVLGLSSRSVL